MLLAESSGNAYNVLVCGLCAKCVGGRCYKAMSIDVTGERNEELSCVRLTTHYIHFALLFNSAAATCARVHYVQNMYSDLLINGG